MPDCHVGYGMPIGGVVACEDAIIPNAVGVDIGCGMCAVQTSYPVENISREQIATCLDAVKARIPLGEGHAYTQPQKWDRFRELPLWLDAHGRELAQKSLGTLGGGNHFIELQASDDGMLWLMLHSGSRNLGYRISKYHHERAMEWCAKNKVDLPSKDLAYLETDSEEGQAYIREMNFALDYAHENRTRMMAVVMESASRSFKGLKFIRGSNIHHNYAGLEQHFDHQVWVHRKGATAAKAGEEGIIPGSMGTSSYIVRGKGNAESFTSCSHGAGRVMGRLAASRTLTKPECDRAMEGIVFSGWHPVKGRGQKRESMLDLSEAPQAYKNIDEVIEAQRDLIEPVVKLRPLGVLKG